jgi:hypothetical protein
VEELNIKPKYWKDLLDDTPFTRKDIIHLQDPLNLQVVFRESHLKLISNALRLWNLCYYDRSGQSMCVIQETRMLRFCLFLVCKGEKAGRL